MKGLLLFLIFLGPMLGAQETSLNLDVNLAYSFPSLRGYESSGAFSGPGYEEKQNPSPVADQFDTLGGGIGGPGLEGVFTYSYKTPFLTGTGALMEGNNLEVSSWVSMTPITFYGAGQLTITPLALLKFRAGAGAGWGWSLASLVGLGLTTNGEKIPPSFQGQLIQGWIGGTFQFDFGALFPGDWTHVITVVDQKLLVQKFTDAQETDPWYWQSDRGENFNGLKLQGTYFLGYQLPTGYMVNMLGILTSTDQYLGTAADLSPMKNGFGSDFIYWTTGPMMNLKFGESSSLVIMAQVQNARKYTDGTTFQKLFTTRLYESSVIELNRIVLAWSQKL